MNIKGIAFVLHNLNEVTLELVKNEEGPVIAGDIALPAGVEIKNPDHVIAHLTHPRHFRMTLKVLQGKDSAHIERPDEDQEKPIGTLYLDPIFNPIQRVSYEVQRARVEQSMDLDRLVITLETNGAIAPKAAIENAAAILQKYLAEFSELKPLDHPKVQKVQDIGAVLLNSIETLKLKPRTLNALRSEGIATIGALLKNTEQNLLANTPSLGAKSIGNIKEALAQLNEQLKLDGSHELRLGMNDGDTRYPPAA
jgi:DNA-directed RNA polymerase subunit alpha